MEKVITIPKKFASEDLVIVQRENIDKLSKENKELKSALRAILAGEVAFKKGRTRSFQSFLKSKFPSYAKNL